MAFSDPQTVTIAPGGAVTLPRVSVVGTSSSYKSNDNTTVLSLSHQYGRRVRRTARLDLAKIAPDPLISAQSVRFSMSTYIVTDMPLTGFTVAEGKAVVEALTGFLSASSGARITQLLGGES